MGTERKDEKPVEGGVPTPDERIVQPMGETVSGTVVTEVDGAIVVDENNPETDKPETSDEDEPKEPAQPHG